MYSSIAQMTHMTSAILLLVDKSPENCSEFKEGHETLGIESVSENGSRTSMLLLRT